MNIRPPTEEEARSPRRGGRGSKWRPLAAYLDEHDEAFVEAAAPTVIAGSNLRAALRRIANIDAFVAVRPGGYYVKVKSR